MALGPDDTICFCFHVPLRKIESFCVREKPQSASQISECLGAGTGCGWCVPILKKIHLTICGEQIPWWRKDGAEANAPSLEDLTAETHRAGRKKYIAEGKGTPPPGAEV